MDKKYWDRVAEDFDSEVLSVVANDKTGVLKECISRHVTPSAVVGEFGCGIGRCLPLLARRAKKVYGVDIAAKALEVARQKCRRFENIEYLECDLQRRAPKVPKLHLILCVNTLLTPDEEKRRKMLANIRRSLRPRGKLLVVAPALESQLWVYNRLAAGKGDDAVQKAIASEVTNLATGTVRMSTADTKYYLEPELELELRTTGFEPLAITKLTYSWSEELLQIRSKKVARPWHWLVEARVGR